MSPPATDGGGYICIYAYNLIVIINILLIKTGELNNILNPRERVIFLYQINIYNLYYNYVCLLFNKTFPRFYVVKKRRVQPVLIRIFFYQNVPIYYCYPSLPNTKRIMQEYDLLEIKSCCFSLVSNIFDTILCNPLSALKTSQFILLVLSSNCVTFQLPLIN